MRILSETKSQRDNVVWSLKGWSDMEHIMGNLYRLPDLISVHMIGSLILSTKLQE